MARSVAPMPGVGAGAVGLPAASVGGPNGAATEVPGLREPLVEVGSMLLELVDVLHGERTSVYLDALSRPDYQRSTFRGQLAYFSVSHPM